MFRVFSSKANFLPAQSCSFFFPDSFWHTADLPLLGETFWAIKNHLTVYCMALTMPQPALRHLNKSPVHPSVFLGVVGRSVGRSDRVLWVWSFLIVMFVLLCAEDPHGTGPSYFFTIPRTYLWPALSPELEQRGTGAQVLESLDPSTLSSPLLFRDRTKTAGGLLNAGKFVVQ